MCRCADIDLTSIGLQPKHRCKDGRLSSAVGAQQGAHADTSREADAINRSHTAVGDGQVGDANQRCRFHNRFRAQSSAVPCRDSLTWVRGGGACITRNSYVVIQGPWKTFVRDEKLYVRESSAAIIQHGVRTQWSVPLQIDCHLLGSRASAASAVTRDFIAARSDERGAGPDAATGRVGSALKPDYNWHREEKRGGARDCKLRELIHLDVSLHEQIGPIHARRRSVVRAC